MPRLRPSTLVPPSAQRLRRASARFATAVALSTLIGALPLSAAAQTPAATPSSCAPDRFEQRAGSTPTKAILSLKQDKQASVVPIVGEEPAPQPEQWAEGNEYALLFTKAQQAWKFSFPRANDTPEECILRFHDLWKKGLPVKKNFYLNQLVTAAELSQMLGLGGDDYESEVPVALEMIPPDADPPVVSPGRMKCPTAATFENVAPGYPLELKAQVKFAVYLASSANPKENQCLRVGVLSPVLGSATIKAGTTVRSIDLADKSESFRVFVLAADPSEGPLSPEEITIEPDEPQKVIESIRKKIRPIEFHPTLVGNFDAALNASSGHPFCPAQLSQTTDTVRVLEDKASKQDLLLCIYNRSAGGSTWLPLSQTSAAYQELHDSFLFKLCPVSLADEGCFELQPSGTKFSARPRDTQYALRVFSRKVQARGVKSSMSDPGLVRTWRMQTLALPSLPTGEPNEPLALNTANLDTDLVSSLCQTTAAASANPMPGEWVSAKLKIGFEESAIPIQAWNCNTVDGRCCPVFAPTFDRTRLVAALREPGGDLQLKTSYPSLNGQGDLWSRKLFEPRLVPLQKVMFFDGDKGSGDPIGTYSLGRPFSEVKSICVIPDKPLKSDTLEMRVDRLSIWDRNGSIVARFKTVAGNTLPFNKMARENESRYCANIADSVASASQSLAIVREADTSPMEELTLALDDRAFGCVGSASCASFKPNVGSVVWLPESTKYSQVGIGLWRVGQPLQKRGPIWQSRLVGLVPFMDANLTWPSAGALSIQAGINAAVPLTSETMVIENQRLTNGLGVSMGLSVNACADLLIFKAVGITPKVCGSVGTDLFALSSQRAAPISEPLSESTKLKLTGLHPTASVALGFGGR